MKTHEFANNLELFARLLKLLPDTELDETLTNALQSVLPTKTSTPAKGGSRLTKPLPYGFEKQLQLMTPAQIEKLLDSDEDGFTVAQISELAERLGIAISKRQSKSALINLITRFFEANQMHSIIRETKNDEA